MSFFAPMTFIYQATCGPSMCTVQQISQTLKQGISSIRTNFSHGQMEYHTKIIMAIRQASEETGLKVQIIGDTPGPKFRIGKLEQILLKLGDTYIFDKTNANGDQTRCYLPHQEIFDAAQVGDDVLLNDGQVIVRITKVDPEQIVAITVKAGQLSSGKGISIPKRIIRTQFPTDEDVSWIKFAKSQGVDAILLSFVQTADDVIAARQIAGNMKLIAKVETPAALENLEEICKVCDAICLARGDLGVEDGIERIAMNQKRIVATCQQLGVQVFAATQYLESLVNGKTPTYAECNDVYNAVLDGVTGILLTGETANGIDPQNAINWLKQLVSEALK